MTHTVWMCQLCRKNKECGTVQFLEEKSARTEGVGAFLVGTHDRGAHLYTGVCPNPFHPYIPYIAHTLPVY